MKPRVYVDFTLMSSGNGAAMPTPVIAGAVLKRLHYAFVDYPGRYALALPKHADSAFEKMRVFADDRDQLDELMRSLDDDSVIRDYTQIGYPRPVPEDFSGTWTEYRRYRIPSRKAGRKPNDTLRERRIAHADQSRMPFFIMQSRSTGQQFGLYVEIRQQNEIAETCVPDSYGLSVTTRSFALPDLP